MTEAEWLAFDNPYTMLNHLAAGYSPRKLRLFACACCRDRWEPLTDERSQNAVEAAEQFADGQAGLAYMLHASYLALLAYRDIRGAATGARMAYLVSEAAHHGSFNLAEVLNLHALEAEHQANNPPVGPPRPSDAEHAAWAAARSAQAALLRDIVGNPFQPFTYPCCEGVRRIDRVPGDATTLEGGQCPTHGRTWHLNRAWLTLTVLSLAQAAYDERGLPCPGFAELECCQTSLCPICHGTGRIDDGTLDPHRLAVLSDALEEAGCPADEETSQPVRVILWGDPDGWHVGLSRGHCTPLYSDKRRKDAIAWAEQEYQVGMWSIATNTLTGNGLSRSRSPHPLLQHLRSPGPHVRGCWAIDLILGKD